MSGEGPPLVHCNGCRYLDRHSARYRRGQSYDWCKAKEIPVTVKVPRICVMRKETSEVQA